MKLSPTWRVVVLASMIFVWDQITKLIVLKYLAFGEEKVIIDGFFKFVHWGNTGAAWSMFRGNNGFLALIALVALVILFLARRHFDVHTFGGQMSLGLISGGIVGNLVDRIRIGHVVDFLRFYVERRGTSEEVGFPAFNVADSAICVGVGLLFILSFQSDSARPAPSGSQP
jgi:signal peptidase II